MKKLLIIGYVWPEPGSSAAGRHMLEIIQLFIEENWAVTFASPAAESTHQHKLTELGVQEATIELNNESFDSWLKQLNPDVVIFDRFMMEEQFGWRVAQVCPDTMRVLDTEDLHFLRLARQAAFKRQSTISADDLDTETSLREIASIYRCDLSLIISEAEQDLLSSRFGIGQNLLHYLPFLYNQPVTAAKAFEQRKDFVFVGTMRHAPNLEAVRHLKKIIWPLIRLQLPRASLYIVGSYLTKEVSQMHKPAEGFHVAGKVDQLGEMLNGMRVSLAPLKYGAGLKGKLLESMEHGLPSVTTTIGAEGICADLKWPGFIADKDQAFADSAVELYQNESRWRQAQQQGFDLLQARFSRAQHRLDFFRQLEALLGSLDKHRKSNFIGRMLQHQSMRSSEYMARWIECKNKNRV